MTDKPALLCGFAAAQEKYRRASAQNTDEKHAKEYSARLPPYADAVCQLLRDAPAGGAAHTDGRVYSLVLRGSWRLRDLFVNPRPVQYSVSVLVSTQWGQALYAF
jgi:hypothetical protein